MKHLPQEQGSAGAVSSSLRPGAQIAAAPKEPARNPTEAAGAAYRLTTHYMDRGENWHPSRQVDARGIVPEAGRSPAVQVQVLPIQPDTPADWLELLSAFTTRSSELIAAYIAAQTRKDVKDGV